MTDERKNAELADAELEQVSGGEGETEGSVNYCPYCNCRHPLNKQGFFTLNREMMEEASELFRGYCGYRNRYFVEMKLKSGGLRYYADNDTIIPTAGA